jgi:hypothetical protein
LLHFINAEALLEGGLHTPRKRAVEVDKSATHLDLSEVHTEADCNISLVGVKGQNLLCGLTTASSTPWHE